MIFREELILLIFIENKWTENLEMKISAKSVKLTDQRCPNLENHLRIEILWLEDFRETKIIKFHLVYQ